MFCTLSAFPYHRSILNKASIISLPDLFDRLSTIPLRFILPTVSSLFSMQLILNIGSFTSCLQDHIQTYYLEDTCDLTWSWLYELIISHSFSFCHSRFGVFKFFSSYIPAWMVFFLIFWLFLFMLKSHLGDSFLQEIFFAFQLDSLPCIVFAQYPPCIDLYVSMYCNVYSASLVI